ncbi:MAG: SPASM domain-containing protein [Candidatus Aminicenantes bacterium]
MSMQVLEKALRLFAIASGGQGAHGMGDLLIKNYKLHYTNYKQKINKKFLPGGPGGAVFSKSAPPGRRRQITFHGGEPLLAGIDFYRKALPIIFEILGNNVNIGMQSNLWALNEEFRSLLSEYNIGISTSIDGPEHINDTQRCPGYFDKTFSGIDLLHCNGISPGSIATFTKYSAKYYREVFDFFVDKNMHFSVHGAVKPIGSKNDSIYLDADEYARLLLGLLDLYVKNLDKIKISTLDTMIKNISYDESGLCTFSRCIGDYLAVTPGGELYSCNRFIGNKEFSLGNINRIEGMADIENSSGWKRLIEWQDVIDKECADCLHKNICHGGCPYAGFSAGNGKPSRDPFCEAYKKVYSYILDRATDEFFSDENYQKLLRGVQGGGFLEKSPPGRRRQEGSLLKIMNDEPHPYDIKRNAKIILASAFFGTGNKLDRLADLFFDNGLSSSRQGTLSALKRLYSQVINPAEKLNNLYIHITNQCGLSCSFCYAQAGNNVEGEFLPVDKIIRIIEDGSLLGFRKVVITGGEPLVYHDFLLLVRGIEQLKTGRGIPPVVLRTNLTGEFTGNTIDLISEVFDEIVVSLDGSREYHDMKRGKGTYDAVMKNLQCFNDEVRNQKISLAAVFDFKNTPKEIIENEKQHIMDIKNHLDLKKIRFLPLLPIGRAKNMDLSRDRAEPMSISQWIRYGSFPGSNCGIGYVVMINPEGNVYPCHVYANQGYYLGNIDEKNLKEIIDSKKYLDLRGINVDKIEKCRECTMRYLCGGGCRVWENEDCSDLYDRAQSLVNESIEILGGYFPVCR